MTIDKDKKNQPPAVQVNIGDRTSVRIDRCGETAIRQGGGDVVLTMAEAVELWVALGENIKEVSKPIGGSSHLVENLGYSDGLKDIPDTSMIGNRDYIRGFEEGKRDAS